ncbi:acid protease [Trichodelitschia bisporula]|uniref:Acid protease n=1 Tax=Trichodelitschia bisporula TaxID=703511 RepID=A0A6G1HUJ7_9PEZI|nr:acid protease [Trichodelitschia bisporula]
MRLLRLLLLSSLSLSPSPSLCDALPHSDDRPRLQARAATPSTLPPPISFAPAQNWEGINGQWNTFALRIGSPEQVVRVYVSTASQQTWVVDPRGCPDDTPTNTTCTDSRGETFDLNKSKTWRPQGLYDLWIEGNLDLYGNGEYGFDTVGLGYPGEGGPVMTGQIVGAIATPDFNYGHLGINPKSTNFTNFTTQSPSFITSLKERNLIPSVSWGYTAGAAYRFAKVLSSLTLGGYDAARFVPNNVSFNFFPDNERDLLVSIVGITADASDKKRTSLFPTYKIIYSYIDSTVSEIWLPIEACKAFEDYFELTWDPTTELYLVSEAQHATLLQRNPNVTFTIQPWSDPKSRRVDITLPYRAFDHYAKPPYRDLNRTSRYFPLRRAANDTQYTLGRTFLQEAYLTVDWERQNFSVAQCSWETAMPQQKIVAIPPFSNSTNSTNGGSAPGAATVSPTKLGSGAIAGIIIAAAAVLIATTTGLYFYFKRPKAESSPDKDEPKTVDTEGSKEDGKDEATGTTLVFPKAELDASNPLRHEAAGGEFYKPGSEPTSPSETLPVIRVEADSKERQVFEMEGDYPERQEADGRMMTEKEAMRVREERYNGVDSSPVTETARTGSARDVLPGYEPSDVSGHSPTGLSAPGLSSTGVSPTGVSPTTPTSSAPGVSPVRVRPGHVVELVSPLDGTLGSRTMGFLPLSPLEGGTLAVPSGERRRFSFEEGTQTQPRE